MTAYFSAALGLLLMANAMVLRPTSANEVHSLSEQITLDASKLTEDSQFLITFQLSIPDEVPDSITAFNIFATSLDGSEQLLTRQLYFGPHLKPGEDHTISLMGDTELEDLFAKNQNSLKFRVTIAPDLHLEDEELSDSANQTALRLIDVSTTHF